MATITITRKKITEEKTEIEIPAYFKSEGEDPIFFYKIFSEHECIQVFITSDRAEVGFKHAGLAFDAGIEANNSNESEFKAAYEKALTTINSKL